MATVLKVNLNQLRRSAVTLQDACTTMERLQKQVTEQVDTLVGPTNWSGNDADSFKRLNDRNNNVMAKRMQSLKLYADNLSAAADTYASMIESVKQIIAGK